MCFRRLSLTIQQEREVIHVDRLARQRALDQRQQILLHFSPYVHERCAKRGVVLRAKKQAVGVVVEQRQLGTPGCEHGLLGTQHDADERLELSWPAVDRSER